MINVLADRHHSGLFHSFQLMARRFDWTLYTPVGHDWWDEGYWRFGQVYGDDRLAQQFLMQVPGVDGLGPLTDGEFPDWPINGVTLEQARAMDWAYVIASVPDNEQGFHRFAREHGAQYVVQVGNTGQYTDWRLDPLALVSSEMPIVGRGVRYHQEMDPIEFRDPIYAVQRGLIRSFVNCMPSMGACWDLLESSGLPVAVHGIDGEAGIVKPFTALLDLMADSAWGWHCKQQGDGFGHVIHSWAAVGRPLIGHASHYRGKMGQVFWRDMETCIDLDRHSVTEVADIIRMIRPERHAEMCRRIRAQFERIDYDREAREIAEFLGVRETVTA